LPVFAVRCLQEGTLDGWLCASKAEARYGKGARLQGHCKADGIACLHCPKYCFKWVQDLKEFAANAGAFHTQRRGYGLAIDQYRVFGARFAIKGLMQVEKALLTRAKDSKRRFRVIRGIGLGGLPADVEHPVLKGYFLGDLLVWVVGAGICLNMTVQQE
jgi:hypothetical protein